ncbi:MAG: dihydroorotase [Alphaproteobacteria bacterium]|nr:dihydroorotase [Alphaproteobacteria bacterium]
MAGGFDLVLKRGTCVTPKGTLVADIGVREGVVAAIGDLGRQPAADTIDASHLHVLPGVIDTQVHFREPGMEHKEDIATGTLAAVKGGVTTVFEMPNTKPPTTGEAELADKFARARGRAWTDIAFFIGATPENADRLGALERLPGVSGVKLFMGSSTGTLLVAEDAAIERVLRAGVRRLAAHCEDETRLKARHALAVEGGTPHFHPVWRDEETAVNATRRLIGLARKTGRKVHVLHVTTAGEMALLGQARDVASVEVTPQHLTLAAPDCYDALGTLAQMNPPIRDDSHRKALWQAVADGIVDVVGSDHAPHTLEEKAKPYPQSPAGMPGVQTLVPLLLNHLHEGRLSLERLVELTSRRAAELYGILGKGAIEVGFDADFTIVDLSARRRIANSWIASKVGWTPFDGMEVTGWPRMTLLRGELVMREDEVLGQARGRPVRFRETATEKH